MTVDGLTPAGGLPLDGVTVVSFEQAVAAPFCTRHLADLGARVIKIEIPGVGDFTRHYDAAVQGLAAHFVWLNRNKESLALDCKNPAAQPVLAALLAEADIVLQNLAPGAAERLGVDAETLVRANPRIIAVDISGYGRGGSLSGRRAYDLLVQAEAGSCAITGQPDAPAKPGIPVADVGVGLYAVVSILSALIARDRTGRGAALEVNMFDTVTDLLGFALEYTKYTGAERPPNGMGSPMVAPYGSYPTSDDQVVVLGTTNDAEWQRLTLRLIERADLAADPDLATNEQRCVHRDRIDHDIAAWCRDKPLAEILERSDAAGIGCARLNSITDVIGHEHLETRDRWRTAGSPAGPVSVLAPVISCADWPVRLDDIPSLGQHNDAILAGLGLGEDEYDRLYASGAAGARPTETQE